MRKLLCVLVVVYGACTYNVALPDKEPFSSGDVAGYMDGVGVLYGDSGGIRCAGAFLEDNRFLTARHCISGQTVIPVGTRRDTYSSNGLTVDYGCDVVDEFADIAILRPVWGTYRRFSVTPIAERPVVNGQEVITIGHPSGLTYSVARGIVSSTARGAFTQTDVKVWFGNSGGPLISEDGIVGVASFMGSGVPHLGFFGNLRRIQNAIAAPPNCRGIN